MKYVIKLSDYNGKTLILEDYRDEGGYPLSNGGIEAITNQFKKMIRTVKKEYPKTDEVEIRETLAIQYKVMIMPQ